MQPDRDGFLIWNEASSLVRAALGLCLMADLDVASDIGPDEDQQIARDALPVAAVSLLRRAATLLDELEDHLAPSAPRTKEAAQ